MSQKNVLLTGSTGFVGAKLLKELSVEKVLCAVRKPLDSENTIAVGDLDASTNWLTCFTKEQKIDVVVHCAARVHIMKGDIQAPLAKFRDTNVEGTIKLAYHAAKAGVKRFVYLSSIKVNGEFTSDKKPYFYDDKPAPIDAYGISKYEAEEALKTICSTSDMEFVIIRPPLVYGPGVKANFLSILKWVERGVPLPLGGVVYNKRSLVFVDNLVDLIKTCIDHPGAANQTFLVSDDDDVSTRELLVRVASALSIKSRLLCIPPAWFSLFGKIIVNKDFEQRLCSSLQVDIEHTKSILGWTPPYSMEHGLKKTADSYKAN